MNCAYHPEVSAMAYCRTCGKPLCEDCKRDVRGVVYCEACIAARLQDTMPSAVPGAPAGTVVPPVPSSGPNPAAAAMLGFIPGVGAIYNGQVMKGFVHVIVFAALVALADRTGFFGVVAAFFYFYMVFDAYSTAKAMQTNQPLPDPFGFNRIGTGTASQFRNTPIWAVVLIGLGVLFLLDEMGMGPFHFLNRYWPVLLIGLGVWLLTRRPADKPAEPPQPPAAS
jgi:TM2 domain-containing membrane protein YozV